MKRIRFVIVILALVTQVACRAYDGLERRVTMPVFAAERLESVIARLAVNTGRQYDVQLLIISGTKAKAADYKDVSMRMILEQQLTGTPFTYRLTKNKLKILNK